MRRAETVLSIMRDRKLRSRTRITGERRDTETVMRRSERGGWKSAHRGNSLAAYSTLTHGSGAAATRSPETWRYQEDGRGR
jgi:hypothetical protein